MVFFWSALLDLLSLLRADLVVVVAPLWLNSWTLEIDEGDESRLFRKEDVM